MKFKIHDQNWRGCHLRFMYMYVQSGGFRWRKNLLSSNALFYINFKKKYFVETWNRLEFNPGNQPQNSLLFCRRAFKRNSINFRSFLFLGNIGQKKMGLNSMNLLIHVILLGCTQVALNFKLWITWTHQPCSFIQLITWISLTSPCLFDTITGQQHPCKSYGMEKKIPNIPYGKLHEKRWGKNPPKPQPNKQTVSIWFVVVSSMLIRSAYIKLYDCNYAYQLFILIVPLISVCK